MSGNHPVSRARTKLQSVGLHLSVFGGLLASCTVLSGCASISQPVATPVVTATPNNVSGNWQVSTTATAGPALGTLSGSIDQSGGITSQGQFTTSVFQFSSACFIQSPDVPLQGFVDGSAITLNSFAVNQQYVVLTSSMNPGGAGMSGQYAVHGGCAEGSTGKLNGVLYAPFTGSYSGPLGMEGTTARAISLQSVQESVGNGSGSFTISGSATFTGFGCFSKGTMSSAGDATLSGSTASLVFLTDDAGGGRVSLQGTLDPTAQQITNVVYTIKGGSCDGQTGSGALTKG